LALTLAAVAVSGVPQSPWARSFIVTFTAVNVVVATINLIPGRIGDGLSTDGAVLWELWRHVFRGGPHPLAKQLAASPVFAPETRLLEIPGMAPAGFTVGVELLNDDSTPMAFVVDMLRTHLKLDEDAATAAMLHIHAEGGLVLALADRAEAEAAASAITRDARAQGCVLACRVVERQHGGAAQA
jgi:ATP-dependent Clp protease adapter protein ClpS